MRKVMSKLIPIVWVVLIVGGGFLVKEVIDRKLHQKKTISHFTDNRETIIINLRESMETGDYESVISLSDIYLITNDEQLNELNKVAKERLLEREIEKQTNLLLAKVKPIPASDYEQNLVIYQQLLSLHPNDEKFTEKVRFYKTKQLHALVNELQENQNKEKLYYYQELSEINPNNEEYKNQVMIHTGKLRYEKTLQKLENTGQLASQKNDPRQIKINNQFSSWNGSHKNLTRFIKKQMNDPSSYEHVETVYWDKGNYLIVKTTFRGKNAYGGIVLNSINAKTSLDGEVLEIIK